MKVIMVDLDGTLFDTKDVNYCAYQEACMEYGYSIEYNYYCEFCNGRHFLDFLPQITTTDEKILEAIHAKKKEVYTKYLTKARLNNALLDILQCCKCNYKIALVTTASKENVYQILSQYKIREIFDMIITRDDVQNGKPNPEGFLKVMNYFNATPNECIVFEDSSVGLEAAKKTEASVFVVKGYN